MTANSATKGSAATGSRFAGVATELSLFAVLVIMVIVFAAASPFFLTVTNLVNIGQTMATSGIVAITMSLVIVSGGIDLSVGSTAALTGVVTSMLWTYAGAPLALAAVLGILAGALVGAINGFMVTRIKINPLDRHAGHVLRRVRRRLCHQRRPDQSAQQRRLQVPGTRRYRRRTLLADHLVRILDNGLVLLNVSSFYQEVASGLVLLLAVGFDQLRQRIGERS